MGKTDIRYRSIADEAPASIVDKALDKKRDLMIHMDFKKQISFLEDSEIGVIIRGALSYHEENRGRKLPDYTAPACIKEAAAGNRMIGVAWSILEQRLMDDMQRYVATSIVRAKAGKAGGDKSAELRAAQSPEERERIKQEIAEAERAAWNEAGAEAEQAADKTREAMERAWQEGIDPVTGEIREGYDGAEDDGPADDDRGEEPPAGYYGPEPDQEAFD